MFTDPFAPFDAFFPRATSRGAAFLPPVDVTVGERDLVLTFDLPGVKAEDLDIEVLDGQLVLRGERKRPEPGDAVTWAHAERSFGAFERSVRLPAGVDPESITASMDDGVLSLIVPKPARLTPKAIRIEGGERQKELAGSAS